MGYSPVELEMKGISIEFPGVKALQDVDFSMESGTIQALIGANGAGKSTLMKVLSGAYPHYTGEIFIDGKLLTIDNPKQSKAFGIDIVYQEVDTALIPYLDVAENIMLDVIVNEMDNKTFVDWKSVHRRANEVLNRLNIELDTRTKAVDLQLAEKQMVLIARALVHERKFLILDEPTAPLSFRETKKLFEVVRDLANNQGIGVIFISHRIPELFEICENISIMKDGRMVTNQVISEINQKQVIEWMLGDSFVKNHEKLVIPFGETVLRLDQVSGYEGKVDKVNLHIRKGEIVGVAGLVGAGKTELCKTIFGATPHASGSIELDGRKITNKSSYQAVRNGFALVPEERRKEGVFIEEPVFKNLTSANLKRFTRAFSFLDSKKEREEAKKMISQISIKTPDEMQKLALLSGGNQQKVAVGKWLLTDAKVLLFDEPTKGVDVGAKGDIFELIMNLAGEGKGILYASSELNEIMMITDRVYVMYDGKVVKELQTKDTTEDEILYYSTGGK